MNDRMDDERELLGSGEVLVVTELLIHLRSVDLPVPEGPIMEMTSPLLMVTLISLRGIVSSSNSFLKCLISIIAHPQDGKKEEKNYIEQNRVLHLHV